MTLLSSTSLPSHLSPPVLARIAARLRDDAATEALGRALAQIVVPRLHLHLHGELGAGKTSLVRAVLRALGVAGPVRSPTYALVETYTLSRLDDSRSISSSLYFQHFDFYRFDRDTDWIDAGLRDLLASDAICAVEWPERAGALLPAPDLDVRLAYAENGRDALLEACTPLGAECLGRLDLPQPLKT